MAPVIGDILHQSDLHPTQANSPLADITLAVLDGFLVNPSK